MAFDSWGLGSRSARRTVEGSRQYQPQERTSSAQLYRCWQTQAVSGHADTSNVSHVDLDNACCVSFGFDVTCESPMHTLLFVACPVLCVGTFTGSLSSYHHQHYHVSMRQLENPHKSAHIWPPRPEVHWEFRAFHGSGGEPFLELILQFALPGQHH